MYTLKVHNPKESASAVRIDPNQTMELVPATKIHLEWDTHFHNINYDERKAKVYKKLCINRLNKRMFQCTKVQ